MINKRFPLGLLFLIFALALAACSAPTADNTAAEPVAPAEVDAAAETAEEPAVEAEAPAEVEPVTLQMSVWGSETDQQIYQTRLDQFHAENPDIQVELVYIPSDYDQKVQTMIAGGTSPDILQLSEAVHAFSSKGQIISLNELAESHGVDVAARFGPTLPGVYSANDTLYALPDRGGAMVVYYNKDAFDTAGVAYPTEDWTWDDMLDAAQKLTIRDGDTVEQYGYAAGGWWPWWMSFIYQNGGEILDANGQPNVNTPEVIEALQFYNDLVYKYGVAPSPEEYADLGTNSPDPLFAQGKVAFQTTGMWNIASLKDAPDLNWDIAPMWHNKKPGTAMFGSGLAISADCPDYEACFRVIDYLTSAAGQLPIAENAQDAPANLEVLSSDAFLNAAWSDRDINMTAFEQSADAIFTPPLVPQWNEIQKVFDDNLSEVFLNQREVPEAVEAIQAQLEDLLNN